MPIVLLSSAPAIPLVVAHLIALFAVAYVVYVRRRTSTARRRTEEKFHRIETRFHDLFGRLHDGAFLVRDGRFVEVNAAMTWLLGYSRAEFLNMRTTEIYQDVRDREEFMRFMERQGGTGFDYAIRFRCKDGEILDCAVTASAILDERGRTLGFQGLIRDAGEQRRLQDALKRSRDDYRELFEHAHDAILILDPATEVVLDVNRRACALYGFTHEQFAGKSMLELSVHPSRGRDFVQRTVDQAGEYLPLESQQYRSDGTIMDVEINAALVTYKGRDAILSINRDATARKREEARVRESEERFRLLLESVVDYAIYMLDPEGRIVSWNEGAERILGYAADEVLGRSFAMFHTPESRAAGVPEANLAAAAERGRIMSEGRHLRKGGTFEAAVVITRVVDEHGVLRGFAKVIRDITERKHLEETERQILAAIQNVAREWTKTFDAVSVPIVLLDDHGRIGRLNEAAARLAGRAIKALHGMMAGEIEGEPWSTIAGIADFYRSSRVASDGRAVDGHTGRVWQITSTPIALNGESRLIIVAYDLTLVTRLEESLRRTEVTSALGALVAGVAHEVRNPLFTISATLDAWEAQFGTMPELRDSITPLREEITRLNDLMRDLLDYAKPRALDLDEVSLAAVARMAISHSSATMDPPVEVILECDDDLPPVEGDKSRLEQALRNLIDNAVQHASGQPVIVRVRKEDDDRIACEVLDRGKGFSREDLARAFVPFYTKRRGGTGLGLAIAQKIATAHGGEITLGNRDSGGAIATLRLPRASAETSSLAC